MIVSRFVTIYGPKNKDVESLISEVFRGLESEAIKEIQAGRRIAISREIDSHKLEDPAGKICDYRTQGSTVSLHTGRAVEKLHESGRLVVEPESPGNEDPVELVDSPPRLWFYVQAKIIMGLKEEIAAERRYSRRMFSLLLFVSLMLIIHSVILLIR